MKFIKKSYQLLTKELINILINVKDHIKDDSDLTWVYYETPDDIRIEIDKYITELEKGKVAFLDEIYTHFLPTAAYQEHSIANNWSTEYQEIAKQFDKIYEALKKYD